MEGSSQERGRDGTTLAVIALVIGLIAAVIALVIGLIAAVIGLFSPAFVYQIPLVLGIAALVVGIIAWVRARKGRRGMAIAGTLLGALALASGVWGAVQVEGADDADVPATKEREEFCNSDTGDRLNRFAGAETESALELQRATDRTLSLARGAPPGAECAVFALDSLADSWSGFASEPGYGDAAKEVRRIRRFQREQGLGELRF